MSTTSDRTNNPVTALRRECMAAWNDLVLGFGHPEDITRWGWMSALYHRALGYWLRRLEVLVRHAILSDAIMRDIPVLKPRPPCERADKRSGPPQSNEDMPRLRRSYSDDCTTWKVSFRMLTRAAPARKARRAPRKNRAPSERRRCRSFAYRIEALRRAINYHEDYVLRFARRLTRLAKASWDATKYAAVVPFKPESMRVLTAYLPQPIAAAIDHILWKAKHEEPG